MSNHSPLVIPSAAEGSAVRLARLKNPGKAVEGPAVSLPGTHTPSLGKSGDMIPIYCGDISCAAIGMLPAFVPGHPEYMHCRGPGVNFSMAFQANPRRDAHATIAGFFYQINITLLRWLGLQPGQHLELECGEDIDTVETPEGEPGLAERRLLEQLKVRTNRTLTLHSPEAS